MLPSGSTTEMLGDATRLFLCGASIVMKWPVQPVSAMANFVYLIGGEGAKLRVFV
jgi:hypothetical protein